MAAIAEALDEKAIRFYQKYGFHQFKQDPSYETVFAHQISETLCQTFNI